MKKRIACVLAICLALGAAVLPGCAAKASDEMFSDLAPGVKYQESKPVEKLLCYIADSELEVGEKSYIQAITYPVDAFNQTVDWSVDKPEVLTVENGHIYAMSEGVAIVTATSQDSGVIAQQTITVRGIVFDDIAFHTYFYDLKSLGDKGKITAKQGNRFCPDDIITQSEFLTMYQGIVDEKPLDSAYAEYVGKTRAQVASELRKISDEKEYGFSLDLREQPAKDFSVEKTINIADYDVYPNNGNRNSLPGIKKAIADAKASGVPCEIVFPKATYYVYSESNAYALDLAGAKNIIVNGNGSKIISFNPTAGFIRADNAVNIVFKNFEFDYDSDFLPYTHGDVIAVDTENATIDVRIDENLPSMNKTWFRYSQKISVLKDASVPGKTKDGFYNQRVLSGWKEIEDGVFRVSLKQDADQYSIGDKFGISCRGSASGGSLRIFFGEDVVVDRVISYASPDAFAVIHSSKNPYVVDSGSLLRYGRHTASTADGFHLSDNVPELWVERTTIEGTGDDGLNTHSIGGHIFEKIDDGVYKMNAIYTKYGCLEVGDEVGAWSAVESRVLGYAHIVSLENKGSYTIVTLDRDIEGITPREPEYTTMSVINFDQRMDCFFATKGGQGLVARGNTFRCIRRYGTVIQSRDALVEGNTYVDCSSVGIEVRALTESNEGFEACRVMIRDNVIDKVGYDSYSLNRYSGGISIEGSASNSQGAMTLSDYTTLSQYRIPHNIVVVDNTIANASKYPVSVGSAYGLYIAGNIIEHDGAVVMTFENAGEFVVKDNSFSNGKTIVIEQCDGYDIQGEVVESSAELSRHIAPGRKSIYAPYGTPNIDGMVDDIWQSAVSVTADTVAKTSTQNDSKATADIKVMWDENYLYVLANVHDPVISAQGEKVWERDSFEIVLDQSNNKDGNQEIAYGSLTGQYRVEAVSGAISGAGQAYLDSPDGSIAAQSILTADGYRIEISIPFTIPLKNRIKDGTVMGIEFQINDDSGVGVRDGIVIWNHTESLSFRTTHVLGNLIFVKED